MRKRVFIFLTVFLVGLISACTSSTPATSTPTAALFFDNFTKTDSGWTRLQNENGISDYVDGYYHILIKTPSTLLISNPGKTFQGDVSIGVDTRKLGGSDDNYFGVLCHYQNPDNYYMFLITNDGYSAIAMRKDGQDLLISPGMKFLKMDGINKGGATNHIRADCIGDTLTLYANGAQVSMAYDKNLTGGDVGLAVRSGSLEGGVDIRFDSFKVSLPAQP